ncbi:MAG TPA: hypothetical protein VLE21_05080 [Candidatus Nitrosocosmicus sp.]|nr:hypothetical protein [Candidatus Nitrosocosmicus sp.]
MNIALPLGRLSYVFISFVILLSLVPAILSNQLNSDRLIVVGQETNSSLVSDSDILASINQTYLSLIPLMIQEVENTNASDIPIRQIMEATPSNVTALQDIVKNSSNRAAQSELTSNFSTTSSSDSNSSNTPKPQDLIPVVVNMTQNTNASDLGFMRVINATPNLETLNLTGLD